MDKATPTPSPASVDKQAALVAKLRYMGKQYAAGQVARGGSPQKHYLEEAAEEIEMMAWALSMNTKTPASAQENADLRNVIQAACIDGLPGLSRAWEKYFPSHPITIKGAEVERLAAQAAPIEEKRCACNERPASGCPGEWEPGCDLGNNPKYVRVGQSPAQAPVQPVSLTDVLQAAAPTEIADALAPVVQAGEPGKYNDVLKPFFTLMERELHANSGKGDRPGWLAMKPDQALLEVYHHVAKLAKAVRDNDGPGIMEYGADVANMAMMVLDLCGSLAWVDADRASSGDAQAVRMLTDEEKVKAWNHDCNALLSYADAVIRAFCAVNAGKRIPASGEIGGV